MISALLCVEALRHAAVSRVMAAVGSAVSSVCASCMCCTVQCRAQMAAGIEPGYVVPSVMLHCKVKLYGRLSKQTMS